MDATQKPLSIPPEYAVYAEKHALFEFFGNILQELGVDKPKDPLQRIIEICKRKVEDTPRVLVLGPPSSGKKTLSKLLARNLKCKHIDSNILLVDDRGEEGLKLQELVQQGLEPAPHLTSKIVSNRLRRKDLLEKGWVMSGYPETPTEASLLQSQGVLTQHVIFLEGSRSVLQGRSEGKRVDSLTGDIYHFPLNMPDNPEVTSRLREVPNASALFHKQWEQFYRHYDQLKNCYNSRERPLHNVWQSFNVDQPLPDLLGEVKEFLSRPTSRSLAPITPRVLLLGPPGAGRNTQAQMLAEKYNLVNIDFDLVLKQVLRKGGSLAESMKPFLNRNLPLPTELLIKALLASLSNLACARRGWVLHSFPNTGAEAESLSSAGVIPNRVLFLDASREVVLERLTLRQVDPVSGKSYHSLYNPAPSSSASGRCLTHPRDAPETVERRFDEFQSYRSELAEMYEDACEHVNAEQDPHAVFECVEKFLVNELSSRPQYLDPGD